MAERRMFSKSIMETDSFLELSDKSKLLYLYLNLSADDDGFIGSVKKLMLFIDADKDNLAELINKKYLIQFESGVCVITHWKAHNYLRNDRYHPTLFQNEKSLLTFNESTRTYELAYERYTIGIPSGRQVVDADKISIDKNSLDKNLSTYQQSLDEIGDQFFS